MKKSLMGIILSIAFLVSCQKIDVNNSLSNQNALSDNPNSLEFLRSLPSYPSFLYPAPFAGTPIREYLNDQSPINIVTCNTVKIGSGGPSVHYGTITLSDVYYDVIEKVLKIKLTPLESTQNYISLGNRNYYLEEFHFHYKSEHSINNKFDSMELHFVNKTNDAAGLQYGLAYGVMISLNSIGNDSYQRLFFGAPAIDNQSHNLFGNETLDLATLLPSDQSKYYSYLGSLTTPNYAEHSDIPNAGPITWILLKNKQKISRTNLDTYIHRE